MSDSTKIEGSNPTHRVPPTFSVGRGAVFRLATLMTHYRQPLDFSEPRMAEAARVLERWVRAAVPTTDGPPIEILEAFCDDLNMAKAIAAMHVWRKADGRKLFAAMRFLGLFDGHGGCPDEWKTLPADHGVATQHGPDTIGAA